MAGTRQAACAVLVAQIAVSRRWLCMKLPAAQDYLIGELPHAGLANDPVAISSVTLRNEDGSTINGAAGREIRGFHIESDRV